MAWVCGVSATVTSISKGNTGCSCSAIQRARFSAAMVQPVEQGRESRLDLSEVHYPAEFGIDFPFQTERDAIGVAVHARARVLGGQPGEPVGGVETEGFGDPSAHVYSFQRIEAPTRRPPGRVDHMVPWQENGEKRDFRQ